MIDRVLLFLRFVVDGWAVRLAKRYDYQTHTDERCDRCGARLLLRGWSDFTLSSWFYCPRCRYRLKKPWQLQAARSADAAGRGMSDEEYDAHMTAQASKAISADPIPLEVLEHARKLAEEYGW